MKIGDFFTVAATMGAIATVLGWWIKIRLDSSIRLENDRLLETFKDELGRRNVLHAERLEAFKVLSERLVALRRYCNACSAEARNHSEFEPRTDSLKSNESISLLQHREVIYRALEERELFVSPSVREAFKQLFMQMNLGFNLELWLSSGSSSEELNARELYDLVSVRVNEVLAALFSDLGFESRQVLTCGSGADLHPSAAQRPYPKR